MGAGLHLTAALTLKSLLGFQPEMIDVIYDPSLLPDRSDLENTIREISQRIDREEDLDDYGFLLAYIGHQLDQPDLIRRGLNAMNRANQDLVFTDLLTRIWLPEVDVDLSVIDLLDDEPVEEPEEALDEAPEAGDVIELVPLIEPEQS